MIEIKLHSRYREKNSLVQQEDGTYKLITQNSYQAGTVNGGKKFVDPSGGPMIVEGSMLKEAGKVVKRVDFIQGKGAFITFE